VEERVGREEADEGFGSGKEREGNKETTYNGKSKRRKMGV